MQRVVANVSLTDAELKARVALLAKKYPNVRFSSKDHETRKQIVVDSEDQIDTPDFEQMVRTANTGV